MTDEHHPKKRETRLAYRLLGAIAIGLAAGYLSAPSQKHVCGSEDAGAPVRHLQAIFDGQARYYNAHGNRFIGSTGLTPGNPTRYMCAGSSAKDYQATESTWSALEWRALGFALTKPSHFAYEIITAGSGADAHFTVRALGDLDCDGIHSTFEIVGRIDKDDPSALVGRHAVYSKGAGE